MTFAVRRSKAYPDRNRADSALMSAVTPGGEATATSERTRVISIPVPAAARNTQATMKRAGSAATAAISPTVSERMVAVLTPELFERETRYRVAMAIAKSMLKDGIITAEDYAVIDTIMIEKLQPILSGLYPQNRLIQ